jgi:helicase
MHIEDLKFPENVNLALKDDVRELNPPQKAAVEKGLLEGKSLVIASPTASGKTFIAEMAILKNYMQGGKAVYIVPLKALASEKYDEFRKKYEQIGMKIAISIGDLDSGDSWLHSYDLIIASNEKMDSLLRHNVEWIRRVSLVIADEIHMLNDPSRGPTLEVVLTRLRTITKSQIIALSATIKNSEEIADWLGAGLVKSDYRPIKLRKGIYYPNKIEFDNGKELKMSSKFNDELDVCSSVLKKNKQALVFVSTRRSSEAEAEKISKKLPIVNKELEKISKDIESVLSSPTKQCRRLASVVKKGAAFHHAGLVAKQRKIIEENFRNGLIKFLAATPTLAYGVNTPAHTVIVRDMKRYSGYGMDFIPVLDVQQFFGRAGRSRYEKEGHAVLIAKTEHEVEELRNRYINGETEPIYSKLSVEPVLRMHVLALVASGTANSRNSLKEFFSKTFFAHQYKDID